MLLLRPLKRSKQLAPLSREHRDALQFALRLKQGLENGVPSAELSPYVRWYWNNFLLPHFKEEENILIADLPADDKLADRMKAEHSNITELITGSLSRASMINVSAVVTDHIRFEERQLFPHIEKTLDKKQLEKIHQQLAQQPHCNEKWGNPFWERKRPKR